MSQSVAPRTPIPSFYRLFFTWADPLLCLWAAYMDFFTPEVVLSSHILSPEPDTGHVMILGQRSGHFLFFFIMSGILLRHTSDIKIWHIVELGLLVTDFVYFWAVYGALGHQGRLWPDTWRPEDWGSIVVTGLVGLVRLAFLARVGFWDEEKRSEKKAQ